MTVVTEHYRYECCLRSLLLDCMFSDDINFRQKRTEHDTNLYSKNGYRTNSSIPVYRAQTETFFDTYCSYMYAANSIAYVYATMQEINTMDMWSGKVLGFHFVYRVHYVAMSVCQFEHNSKLVVQ